MKVKIRTEGFRLSLPVPVGLAGFVIKLIPRSAFEKMRGNTPEPYRALITKENMEFIVGECMDVLKENKGLEIVHVEAKDGTFVSVKM